MIIAEVYGYFEILSEFQTLVNYRTPQTCGLYLWYERNQTKDHKNTAKIPTA